MMWKTNQNLKNEIISTRIVKIFHRTQAPERIKQPRHDFSLGGNTAYRDVNIVEQTINIGATQGMQPAVMAVSACLGCLGTSGVGELWIYPIPNTISFLECIWLLERNIERTLKCSSRILITATTPLKKQEAMPLVARLSIGALWA